MLFSVLKMRQTQVLVSIKLVSRYNATVKMTSGYRLGIESMAAFPKNQHNHLGYLLEFCIDWGISRQFQLDF